MKIKIKGEIKSVNKPDKKKMTALIFNPIAQWPAVFDETGTALTECSGVRYDARLKAVIDPDTKELIITIPKKNNEK